MPTLPIKAPPSICSQAHTRSRARPTARETPPSCARRRSGSPAVRCPGSAPPPGWPASPQRRRDRRRKTPAAAAALSPMSGSRMWSSARLDPCYWRANRRTDLDADQLGEPRAGPAVHAIVVLPLAPQNVEPRAGRLGPRQAVIEVALPGRHVPRHPVELEERLRPSEKAPVERGRYGIARRRRKGRHRLLARQRRAVRLCPGGQGAGARAEHKARVVLHKDKPVLGIDDKARDIPVIGRESDKAEVVAIRHEPVEH